MERKSDPTLDLKKKKKNLAFWQSVYKCFQNAKCRAERSRKQRPPLPCDKPLFHSLHFSIVSGERSLALQP